MNKILPMDMASIARSRRMRDLANSEFLEETGASRLVRSSIYVTAVAIFSFLTWTYFATIQEVVQTTGKVIPRNDVRTVQHLEGGILSEVMVTEGQRVSVGDELVRLDASVAHSELEQARSRLDMLKLEEERIRALVENRMPNFNRMVTGNDSLKADQSKIFVAEQIAQDSQISVLKKQIIERETQLVGIQNKETNAANRNELVREEFAIQENLFNRGLRPRVEFLQSRQKMLLAENELQRLKDEKLTAIEAIAALKERRQDLDNRLKQDALRRLGQVIAQRAELEKSIVSLQDRVNRLVVKSPVGGVVQDVPLQANAGVLPPGGVVAKIVPIDGDLLVESRINTRDVGFLEIGQAVSVKVNAFDYARYGVVPGSLSFISPTTFIDEDNSAYYLAKIEINKKYVGESEINNQILPGMTVQADITTGDKTIFQYILKPIYTVINESFFER
ncbi:MAG: HlyD family type I secretion periplasmic adaptor subunit [Hyphomicrobiales bacterium]|nr:HlyD family type I secretion periplasmic adaptor subunit [Hyphomicrobiales bacterium]